MDYRSGDACRRKMFSSASVARGAIFMLNYDT
jgi:hypothetical protein